MNEKLPDHIKAEILAVVRRHLSTTGRNVKRGTWQAFASKHDLNYRSVLSMASQMRGRVRAEMKPVQYVTSSGRGSGRTTNQLKALAKDGVYIVLSGNEVPYTRMLCQFLERPDIKVESTTMILEGGRWRGRKFTAVELDHHAADELPERLWYEWQGIQTMIRKGDKDAHSDATSR